MEEPNWNLAYVPLKKLNEYLLSETHVEGRSKARYFISLGFQLKDAGLLEHELLSLVGRSRVHESIKTRYGTKHIVIGMLHNPQRKTAILKTIWLVPVGGYRPRFVTAYPL